MRRPILKPYVISLMLCFLLLPSGNLTAGTIELKISHFMPTKHVQHKVLSDWAQKMETVTNGQLKFKIFPGGQLGKPPQQYDSAVHGLTDIAFGLHSYTTGRFPLTAVMRIPFLVNNAEVGSAVFWKVYEKYLKEEHKDTKVLWLFCHGPGQVFTTKKLVKRLEDFNGLKIRSPGKIMSKVLQKFGAAPVGMPITQVYTGLERGTLDGVVTPWEVMRPFKFYEKTRFATVADLYSMTFFVTMNRKKYETLPANLKKAIDEHSGETMAKTAGKAYDNSDAPGRKLALSKGMSEYVLPPEELSRWNRVAGAVTDEWVAEMEAKGLPAKEVLKYTKALLRKQQ